MKPNIELHIEELILHGLEAPSTHQIGEAVQQEITRVLEAQGLPAAFASARTVERLNAGSFHAAPGASGATIGAQIAQSVYTGFAK